MTTLKCEHVTPERLMSRELSIPCGAVLPAPKRGAAVSTPNGRLVSEEVIGRRTQSPPEPRAEAPEVFPYAHEVCGVLAHRRRGPLPAPRTIEAADHTNARR